MHRYIWISHDNWKISAVGHWLFSSYFTLMNLQSKINLIWFRNTEKSFLSSREKLVKEFLYRHVTCDLDLTSDEQILVDKYNLPLSIILSSKAQRAEYDKQWLHAVRLWIDARQWRQAHETFCHHVFHDILLKGLFSCSIEKRNPIWFDMLQEIMNSRGISWMHWIINEQILHIGIDVVVLHDNISNF